MAKDARSDSNRSSSSLMDSTKMRRYYSLMDAHGNIFYLNGYLRNDRISVDHRRIDGNRLAAGWMVLARRRYRRTCHTLCLHNADGSWTSGSSSCSCRCRTSAVESKVVAGIRKEQED